MQQPYGKMPHAVSDSDESVDTDSESVFDEPPLPLSCQIRPLWRPGPFLGLWRTWETVSSPPGERSYSNQGPQSRATITPRFASPTLTSLRRRQTDVTNKPAAAAAATASAACRQEGQFAANPKHEVSCTKSTHHKIPILPDRAQTRNWKRLSTRTPLKATTGGSTQTTGAGVGGGGGRKGGCSAGRCRQNVPKRGTPLSHGGRYANGGWPPISKPRIYMFHPHLVPRGNPRHTVQPLRRAETV